MKETDNNLVSINKSDISKLYFVTSSESDIKSDTNKLDFPIYNNSSESDIKSDTNKLDSPIYNNSSIIELFDPCIKNKEQANIKYSYTSTDESDILIQLNNDSKEYTITKDSYTSTNESDILTISNDRISKRTTIDNISYDHSITSKYNTPIIYNTSSDNNSNSNSITKKIFYKHNQDNNMISVGTNTEDLVMTLKIPFNSRKIIEAQGINIPGLVNYKNKNFEKEKRDELDQLKKTLLKRNEKKMRKMFDLFLEKNNLDIEDEIFKSSMGIPLDDNNTNLEKETKINNSSAINNISNLSSSDPFHMDYKFIANNDIVSELNNLNLDEKKNYHKNRRNDILKQTLENNKSYTSDSHNNSENNIRLDKVNKNTKGLSGTISSLATDLTEQTQSLENLEKKDEFEKRKKLRKDKYYQRKKKKKNIINSYFDMVYVISMKEDNNKVDPLLQKLKENKVDYLLSTGINAKDDTYSKYNNRWRYQLGDKNIKLTKQLFDYDIYIDKNPDLIKGKITNKSRAWNHWKKAGKNENRPLYDKSNIKNIAQVGCLLAHNKVIIDAIKKKYNNILILEDDVYLHNNFFDKIEDIMNNIPKNWHILYMGAIQKDWTNINTKKNYYVAKNTYGSFAYGINKSIFEKIKKLCFELTEPYDKCLQKLHEYGNSYVLYPNLIITNIKDSKIHRSRSIIKYSKIFKWDINDYELQLYDQNKNNNNLELSEIIN